MFWILITFLITKISDEEMGFSFFFFFPLLKVSWRKPAARKEKENLTLDSSSWPPGASPLLFSLIE